jgi:hypothetical protein
MEATIRWIMVLAGTVLTHGKRCHGRNGAVIWHVLDNGKPRPAVRTVGQGIAIAAIGWLAQFTQAIYARSHVRRDKGMLLQAPMAWGDDEPGVPALRRHRAAGYPLNHREWWGLPLKGNQEPLDIALLAFCLNAYPLAIV